MIVRPTMARYATIEIEAAGRSVEVSSPDKVLFSERGGARDARAAPRARPRGLSEDDWQEGHPRLPETRAALRLLRRSRRRGGTRARARAAPAGPHDGGMVEGGARPARLRRLQPERP